MSSLRPVPPIHRSQTSLRLSRRLHTPSHLQPLRLRRAIHSRERVALLHRPARSNLRQRNLLRLRNTTDRANKPRRLGKPMNRRGLVELLRLPREQPLEMPHDPRRPGLRTASQVQSRHQLLRHPEVHRHALLRHEPECNTRGRRNTQDQERQREAESLCEGGGRGREGVPGGPGKAATPRPGDELETRHGIVLPGPLSRRFRDTMRKRASVHRAFVPVVAIGARPGGASSGQAR